MTKKNFFKGLATVLLFPGGLVFVFVASVLLAVLLAAAVYSALFWAAAKWLISEVRYFFNYSWKSAPKRDAARTEETEILWGNTYGQPEDKERTARIEREKQETRARWVQ